MSAKPHNLRDNHQRGTVASFLEHNIKEGSELALVTAYFTVFAYARMKKVLERAQRVRLLFGDPTFIEGFEAQDGKAVFAIQDEAITLQTKLEQREHVVACLNWFKRDDIAVCSMKYPGFLHGKMAHIQVNEDVAHAIVGSSNFTVRGLGLAGNSNNRERNNVELNLIAGHNMDVAELLVWYNELWNDVSKVEDVKERILAHLERFYADQTPEFIYRKTLFHIFGSHKPEVDGHQLERSRLKESAIWKALYDFQKRGAESAIQKLETYGGCILADSVGLGKTYTALAVIKHYANRRVLVLCPKRLEQNWELFCGNSIDNPFLDEHFHYTVRAHTDMGRSSEELDREYWSNYALVVIDESHNFRNNSAKDMLEEGERMTRYQFVMEKIIRSAGERCKVLLLSATPVNNSLIDLRNQISFIVGGDVSKDSVANARYAQTLRLPSIQSTIASAQRAFANWAKSAQRSKPELLENLSGDFSKLLDALTIARSRRQIQNFFGDEMSKIGGFPKREKPQSEYIEHIDSQHQFPDFANVAQQLSRLKLVIYSPSSFLRTDLSVADQSKYNALRGATLTQAGREKALVGIMKVMFLKRLESSVHAFALTLERTVINIDALLPKIARYQAQSGDVAVVTGEPDEQDRDDDNADEFIVGKKLEYQLAHLDLGRWQTQLQEDRAVLVALLASARAVNVARDTKLARIKELLIKKLAQSRRKVIVFSAFAETAQYLYKSLKDELLENHQAHSGLVTGSSAMQNLHPRRIKFNEVLSDFSPQSKKRSPTIHGQLDILFATDCISEGQNLQDCDTVINCDIHWNPVRIIQRFGRIDRIGSRATSVQMINFWPTPNLDQYLGLVHRVEARMSLVDAVATQSDNPLQPTPTDLDENNLRNQQLKRLSEEVIDLEQDEQSVTLADLTLDEFRQDLQQFLNAQRQELEEAPLGLFAVVPPDPQIHLAEAGILFCLRDKPASNSAEAATDSPLPQHRYYLLYVRDDGLVRLIHHQAKQVLNLWRALSMGKTTAYSDLCRAFDRQTQNGQDMSQTTALLKAALASIKDTHIDVAAHKITSQRDFILPPKLEERLSDERTFELVTWLVIQGKPI